MRATFLSITLLSVFIAPAQPRDSVCVSHNKEGYLSCIKNGEYIVEFERSQPAKLWSQEIPFSYSVEISEFTFKDCTLKLDKNLGPVVSDGVRSYKLDSMPGKASPDSAHEYYSTKVASIAFGSNYYHGSLGIITFMLADGSAFSIGLQAPHKWNAQYNYTYIKITSDSSTKLLMETDGRSIHSLAFESAKTERIAILIANWKWKKFEWLTIGRSSIMPQPLRPIYTIYYNRSGRVKPKSRSQITTAPCTSNQ